MSEHTHSWRFFFGVFLLGFLMVSGMPLESEPTRAQADMITLDIPPQGLIIHRNPVIIRGSISDPAITTVYINKVNSPVMVLGRKRTDMPGVPFPVVDGRFTGYAAFLSLGLNTVRVMCYDRDHNLRTLETQVVYNSSGFEAFDVVPNLKVESLREVMGRPFEFSLQLRSRTAQVQTGIARLDLIRPDGSAVRFEELSYSLPGNQRQTFKFTLEGNLTTDLGVYQVNATIVNTQGVMLADDTVYFETYRAEAYPFVDVSSAAGIHFLHELGHSEGGGGSWADYDNDGDYDLFVTNLNGSAKLYRNNGDATFAEVMASAGLRDQTILRATRAGVWGDYDNDGYRDLFVTSSSLINRLYHNNGNGTFTDVTMQAGIRPILLNSYSAAWGDYDNDGFLDLYVSGNLNASLDPDYAVTAYPNLLYHNNGNGTFTETGSRLGVADQGPTLACQWLDFDYDGDVDLFVINDFSAFTNYPGTIYRNDGPGGQAGWKFTDVGAAAGVHQVPLFGMGLAMADYDGDEDQDFFVSNLGIPCLYRNDHGVYVDGTIDAGSVTSRPPRGPFMFPNPSQFPGVGWLVNTWGAQFWDYDLDGWLDLYVCASEMGTENFPIAPFNPNWFFRNNGDGTMTNVATELGVDHPGRTRGIALADYDNDGDVDMYLANNDQYGVLLRNDLPGNNNWIKIELRGTVSNRDAIGSRIVLTAGGRTQIRLHPNSDPQSSQPAPEQVFGLGQTAKVDRLTIYWPSGLVQTLTDVDPSAYGPAHKLIVTEPN